MLRWECCQIWNCQDIRPLNVYFCNSHFRENCELPRFIGSKELILSLVMLVIFVILPYICEYQLWCTCTFVAIIISFCHIFSYKSTMKHVQHLNYINKQDIKLRNTISVNIKVSNLLKKHIVWVYKNSFVNNSWSEPQRDMTFGRIRSTLECIVPSE